MPRQKKQRLKQRKDGRYRCKYHDLVFYGSTEAEALEKREAYKAGERKGFHTETVSGYALPWLERSFPAVADTTYEGLAIHLQHLVDNIGDKRISEVVPSDIKAIYSAHYNGLSNSYIKAARQLFTKLFDSALADGLIRSNPARDSTAKPHRGGKPKTRPITDQERYYILHYCTSHRAFPAVMAMLYAGLRPPEAKALIIDRDIDFENDIITLHQFAHKNGSKYTFTATGKTDKAARQIPLLPPLKTALKGRTGPLVISAHGEQINPTTWRVLWQSYRASMETAINGTCKRWYGKKKSHQGKALPEWIDFDIVPYDLRHSFCVMCRDSGVEINTCRKWLGHADSKMILQVYDSVSEDRTEQERKKLLRVRFGIQENAGASESIEK